MIFVTVGTHEQPFNRLIKTMDRLRETGNITEEVIMQIGFSTYEPKHCIWNKLYPYGGMLEMVEKARIIITHGGPSSFMMPLQVGKIPIVVPRQKQYSEHVNNHQMEFACTVAERLGNIIVVEDITTLGNVISRYEEYCKELLKNHMTSSKNKNHIDKIGNNQRFNERLKEIVREMGVE